MIFFLIILFTYLSYIKFNNKVISIFLRVIAIIIFLFYFIDVLILKEFATHLTINDIFKHVGYAPKYIEQLYSISYIQVTVIIVSLGLIIFFLFKNFSLNTKKEHSSYILILIFLISLNLFTDNGRFTHSWLYKNFLEYNYDILSQSKPYSNEFKTNLSFVENKECTTSTKNSKNIIVLMVESLASYQSDYFSGIKNWTPSLDKIAQDSLSFKNFHANGFVTEDAEIAILTGEFPIYAASDYSNGGGVSFNGFYNIKNSLPNLLKEQNYTSEFITSSDLEFSNTGEWAKSIGFDYIEGSEHPYYEGKKRFHFNAAADEYLYNRVLDRVKQQDSKYFLFIKTVTSHAPFINPENSKRLEDETIKYVDKQIGLFYKKLQEQNFFNNGILLIVGDHHPIIPIKKDEIEKFGDLKAASLVPMIISGLNKTEDNKKQFQQTDIFTSLKNFTSNESCTSKWNSDFLEDSEKEAKYVLHRRGDQRGIVSVFTSNNSYNIRLDGDNTKILDNSIDLELLDRVNYTRIQREKIEFKQK